MASQETLTSTMSREVIRTFQEDLRKLVNNPEKSDLVVLCEDEVEVHACRLLLTVRSSFFENLLQNGMAETGKSKVVLPTVESSVFVIVLRYLYTVELSEEELRCKTSGSDQLDWELLLRVVVAARYFMLDNLERDILERLQADIRAKYAQRLCHTESMRTEIALELSAFCQHLHLCCEGGKAPVMKETELMDEIGCGLVDVLGFDDLSPVTLLSLSKEALNYYLIKIRLTPHQETDEFSEWSFTIDEYLKLRKILLWCALRSFRSSDIRSFDPVCLPGRNRVIEYIGSLEGSEEPDQIFFHVDANSLSLDREALVNTIDKEVLNPFVEMVEFSSIHPRLLFGVIKPLDIIKPELLNNAFCEQAMFGPGLFKQRKICKAQTYLAGYDLTMQAAIGTKRQSDRQMFGPPDIEDLNEVGPWPTLCFSPAFPDPHQYSKSQLLQLQHQSQLYFLRCRQRQSQFRQILNRRMQQQISAYERYYSTQNAH